ncbi:putative transcription factor cmr1 protein [Neofusicoccum parvum UCRNP2]|uniref:Putative transcription factor cmr1 protein n=1 Tax=Botryosphaeria parva (strain UCR-NP2) TaxID=1287680 RepID=R1GIK3_BOTPV|nr:putative transcription factor cmr1 protein [Neofusicoccum parvum UCRNP2]
MVFCTYCGQSFTRDEHLERHILTHTNVKPFKCFTCHMSFARRDLLQRHYTVHGRDQNNQEGLPPSNGIIPKSAGRTPIACSNCAKTKTKCDKKFPCSRCAGRNLKCTLRPTRRVSKQMNRIGGPVQPGENGVNGVNEKPMTDGPPSFFEHASPTSGPPAVLPNGSVISPIPPTPMNDFVQHTPMSGYEQFAGATGRSSEQSASPQFTMDWQQMHMATPFDMAMMAPDMGMDFTGMHSGPQGDNMFSMMPDFTQALPPVQTPITTPQMDRALSDLELGSSASMLYPTRQASISSNAAGAGVPDLGAIIAAQDGWSVFRCTPPIPSSSCPRTAKLNLERLEQSLKNHESWSNWRPQWEDGDFPAGGERMAVMQLQENSRDKLLAITQSFLHKALDIHKEGMSGSPAGSGSPLSNGGSNFVLLPPARVLEYFLRSYANSFEAYFPMTARGVLDANSLLSSYNDKASSLLVLMMIAQGAMVIPSVEARWLTGGLTEACRISLFDLIEKNIIMSGDPIVLHSALLFTVQAAWSGDKWQMDIAMGQRGMYFAMLRHSGILEPRHAPTPRVDHSGPDGLWEDWIQHESRSRLIYSWAMVDQELSLFHDTAPLFSVTEFGAPMPDADCLWTAKSATEWSETFNQVHEFAGGFSSVGSGARPLSLRDLFRHFLDDEISAQGIELTPLHLRLLLHPLQTLVCQYCQLLSCFSDNSASRQRTRAVTAASTRVRLEEVQSLLQRWYDLADRYMKSNAPCALMQANLVLFHLISLNAVTNLPEIERLARRENFDGSYQQLMWLHKRCISDVEEAIFHCGQVLRLVRSMPRAVRPPWWAGAIYRVALILWTDALTHNEGISPPSAMFPVPGPSFAVDSLPAEHPLISRYLTKREGVPTLTKRDGSQLGMDNAFAVLTHCIDVVDEGYATRFSDGIRGKLERLARG